MKNAIVINQLDVNFGQHHILKDVNIEFVQHEITVLIGHSGCGKTTLLRSLNRLNEEYTGCQTTGQVTIDFGQGLIPIYPDGKSPDLSLSTLRHRVGMVFQTPQLLPVSIYRNIAMPLELVANCPNKGDVADKVESALRQVSLFDEVKDRLHVGAEQLSGGQQQRLCLARTLALEPKVLLLDEPTSSLDIHTTKMIEDLILDLREHYTIVMVSHNLEQAIKLADTIFVMNKDHSIIMSKHPFLNKTIHDLMCNGILFL